MGRHGESESGVWYGGWWIWLSSVWRETARQVKGAFLLPRGVCLVSAVSVYPFPYFHVEKDHLVSAPFSTFPFSFPPLSKTDQNHFRRRRRCYCQPLLPSSPPIINSHRLLSSPSCLDPPPHQSLAMTFSTLARANSIIATVPTT